MTKRLPSRCSVRGFVAAIATSSLAVAHAEVFVVDPSSSDPTTFDTIHSALAVAGAGDTIVIHDGEYPESILTTKGVSIVAAAGAEVVALGFAAMQLPSDQSVVVRGLTLGGGSTAGPGAILVEDCDGRVWIEDCHTRASVSVGFVASLVRNSAHVVLSRCEFDAPGIGGSSLPAPTLGIHDSSVRLFECRVTGKSKGANGGLFTSVGYPAVRVNGGAVAIEGGRFTGGDGGDWTLFGQCASVGDGGTGLVVHGGAVVSISSVDLVAGNPGSALGHACAPAASGLPIDVAHGSTAHLVVAHARTLVANSPVGPGDTVHLTFDGGVPEPGDLVWFLFSLEDALHAPTPALKPFSTYLALNAPTIVFLGPRPSTTPFSIPVTVPALPVGFGALGVALQSAWYDASVGITMPSSPTRVAIVE